LLSDKGSGAHQKDYNKNCAGVGGSKGKPEERIISPGREKNRKMETNWGGGGRALRKREVSSERRNKG